ncbi:MAG: response regulator [Candidatus Omnitrophica bacterium]|nr:response regulator [Candidatus Omnitrophota bacterium]
MKKGHVLVIDDELVICTLLADVLKDKGYNVDYTQSAVQGLKAVAKGGFDVIIIDLKMPEMDGIELLREIKLKEDPEAVVVVITGHGSLASAQHALRLGAYDYITKPFRPDRIYFTIRRAIASKKLVNKNRDLINQLQEQRNNLEERVRQGVSEAEFVYYTAREISSTLELDKILKHIVDSITERLGLERCAILLFDRGTDVLSVQYARGLNKEAIKQTKIKRGEAVSGWVAQQKEYIFSEDVNSDPRFSRRKLERYYSHSLISIPLINRGECIGVLNANNKTSEANFTDSEVRLLRQIAAETSIGIENARLYDQLQTLYMRTVKALTAAIDAKDHYTMTHSQHVVKYSTAIAEEMGLSALEVQTIKQASELHDLGRLGVHDYILTKSEELTAQEWEEVKLHALKGIEILEPLNLKREVTELIKQHHERFDGKGYPSKLKGEQIQLGARIMAVADAYDAMITKRPYREARTKDKAIKELKKNSSVQFDPFVVESFLKVLKKEIG